MLNVVMNRLETETRVKRRLQLRTDFFLFFVHFSHRVRWYRSLSLRCGDGDGDGDAMGNEGGILSVSGCWMG